MADIADIGFKVDTAQLDTAKTKVDQLFNAVREQTASVNQVNTSIQGLTQRVAAGADRQVQAHLRTRKAVEGTTSAISQLTERVESGSTRQIQAHARTRRAIQDAAAQAQLSAAQQATAYKQIEAAIQRQNLVATSSAMAQYDQMERLIRQMGRVQSAQNRTTQATSSAAAQARVAAQATQSFQDRLLGTANAIAVLNGPLGGVASRFSSMAVLLGRFGIAGGLAAVAVSALSMYAVNAVANFREFETSFARLSQLAENLAGNLQMTSGEIQNLIAQTAFATLESVQTVTDGVMSIIGLSVVTNDNMSRIISLSADMSAAGMGDIGSSAKTLAMALDDPERALTRLNRRIQMFSEDEIKSIQLMDKMGYSAEAQAAIMGRLEDTVGGVSQAYGVLDGNFDTISQGLQTISREAGSFLVGFFALEGITGLVASNLKEYADALDKARGIGLAEEMEVIKSAIEESDTKLKGLVATRDILSRSTGLTAMLGLVYAGFANTEEDRNEALKRQLEQRAELSEQENKRVQDRLNLVSREVELTRELLSLSSGEVKFREFASNRGVPLQAKSEEDTSFFKRVRDELKLTEEQYLGLLANTRELFALEGQRSLSTDAANIVDKLNEEAAVQEVLIANYEKLSTLPTDIQRATVVRQRLINEGATEADPVIKGIDAAIARITAADAGVAEKKAGAGLETAYDNAAESIQVALNNAQKIEVVSGMTAGQKAREEAIQKAINDQLVKGAITAEGMAAFRAELEIREAGILSALEGQADANARNLQLDKEMEGLTGARDNAQATLSSLQAQQVVMGQLGVKTENNSILYEAMVVAVQEQLRLQSEGVTLAEDLSDRIGEAVDSTYAAASAAQILANNMSNANSQAAAYAATMRSIQSGVVSDEDRSLQAREVLRLRKAGSSPGEAEAQALGAVMRAQFDRNRPEGSGVGPTQQRAEEEAQIKAAVDARRQALGDTEALTEFEKALRDSIKETGSAAASSSDNIQKRVDTATEAVRRMIGQLDPAAAAAMALANDIETLDDALALGVITGDEHLDMIRRLAMEYEQAKTPVQEFFAELDKQMTDYNFTKNVLTSTQDAFANFLGGQYDEMETFEDAVRAMGKSIADTVRQQAADALAAWSIKQLTMATQNVLGKFGIGGGVTDTGGDGGAAALSSAGLVLSGSGRSLAGSALALNQAAAALAASGVGGAGGGIAGKVAGAAAGESSGDWFTNALSGVFGGFFDEGGYLPPGKIGIAGERGPELIAGPATVTSRRETAKMMSPERPQVNQKIINVLDPSIVADYLEGGEGEEVVLNILKRNGVIG
jgi:hypothetical protein